jgi:hypothetical protein
MPGYSKKFQVIKEFKVIIHLFLRPCFLQITQAGKIHQDKKNTRLFLHRLTSSYIFLCLQAPLVCLVVITSNSGLCEAPLGTLPWMPAMDVPVLMLP